MAVLMRTEYIFRPKTAFESLLTLGETGDDTKLLLKIYRILSVDAQSIGVAKSQWEKMGEFEKM